MNHDQTTSQLATGQGNGRRNVRSRIRTFFTAVAVAAMSLVYAADANAIIVQGKVSMPFPANGWVGSFNGASAVCVGPTWIITAKHVNGYVGCGFYCKGQWYTAVEIRNHPTLDLTLARVNRVLPGYHNFATKPGYGDPVILGGCGITAGNALPNNGGYDWTGPTVETWGANTIASEGSLLAVYFNQTSPIPYQATFALYDSGAGMFVVNAHGDLELAGVAVSVTGYGSAAYGVLGFALNVDLFRNWAAPIVNPAAPLSSATTAPRASLMPDLPGLPAWLTGTLLAASMIATRRRRAA